MDKKVGLDYFTRALSSLIDLKEEYNKALDEIDRLLGEIEALEAEIEALKETEKCMKH